MKLLKIIVKQHYDIKSMVDYILEEKYDISDNFDSVFDDYVTYKDVSCKKEVQGC